MNSLLLANLKKFLTENGVSYEHMIELGNIFKVFFFKRLIIRRSSLLLFNKPRSNIVLIQPPSQHHMSEIFFNLP
jgi:hypothetical protein